MIALAINGVEYSNFTEVEVTRSMDSLSGVFRFDARSKTPLNFPIKVGDACSVLVDNTEVLNGFVDIVGVTYDTGSHSISIEGRDKTSDLIDTKLKQELEFEATISLKAVAEKVLAAVGITGITVTVEDDLDDFGEGEVVAGEQGASVFDILEQYARKRQVMMTGDGRGNIVFTRGSGEVINVELINQVNDPQNNILSADVSYDHSQRYSTYIVTSQLNASSLSLTGITDPGTVVDRDGRAVDSDIRSGRTLVIIAETSSDKTQCDNRAIWEANIRRTRSFSYSPIVKGHSHNAGVWDFNKLVKVRDVFADLDGQYLINSIIFATSESAGSTTTLGLVMPDAYTQQASEPSKQKRSNDTGLNFQ